LGLFETGVNELMSEWFIELAIQWDCFKLTNFLQFKE